MQMGQWEFFKCFISFLPQGFTFTWMPCNEVCAERKAFFYPPYARLTSLTLRHRDPSVLRNGVMYLAARLRTRFGRRLLGPMTPPVDRIRGEYLVGLLLKIESGASSARARELLTAELKTFAGNPAFKSITVVVNVDPQ